jgi:hypothetical protein
VVAPSFTIIESSIVGSAIGGHLEPNITGVRLCRQTVSSKARRSMPARSQMDTLFKMECSRFPALQVWNNKIVARFTAFTSCGKTRYGGRRGFQPPHNANKTREPLGPEGRFPPITLNS